MDEYRSIDSKTTKKYGKLVKALEIANIEYKDRYYKLSHTKTMKEPPLTGRIFSGYVVVRNLGKENEYETWMPVHVFDELYEKV